MAARQQVGKVVHVAAGKCGFVLGARTRKNNRPQPRQAIEDRNQRLRQRRRSDDGGGAAVAEYVGVLLDREQCIERQHDDSGADAAPERHGKIDGVVEKETEPLLRSQPEVFQRCRKPAGALLQLAVTQ